jgi:hypothetical protein
MKPEYLILVSAGIVGLLGTTHLVLTYFGKKLRPRDPGLATAMGTVSPGITRRTTMWRAWVGFNVSHSLGAMLFGLVYGYLALVHPEWLFASPFLEILGLALLAAYVLLAKLYWFSTPLAGASLALVSYLAGLVLAWVP